MANVKICDRCGERVDSFFLPVTIKPIRYILTRERYGSLTSHDLCRNCGADLAEFMKGKVKEET